MGRNYFLLCEKTKSFVWIGQGNNGTSIMGTLYYGEPHTMRALKKFLNDTKKKKLILIDENNEVYNLDNFKEYQRKKTLEDKKEMDDRIFVEPEKRELRVFDHPMTPAIIVIAWAIGVIMGMILAYTSGGV